MSKKHLPRYWNEIGFRWDHRTPAEIVTKSGKIVMVALPVIDVLDSLPTQAVDRQLRWAANAGIRRLINN
jgi:hypothetical protein